MSDKEKNVEEVAPDASIPRGELASSADAEQRQEDAKKSGRTETVLYATRRATGKPRATETHAEKYDFVTVTLKRDYGYDGVVYGPGTDIEVPEGLASMLGLSKDRPVQRMTRAEEHEAGLNKAGKKGDDLPVIPLSDPRHEAPGEEERQAAAESIGASNEQLEERQKEQEREQQKAAAATAPRNRAASAPK